jgi:integrase
LGDAFEQDVAVTESEIAAETKVYVAEYDPADGPPKAPAMDEPFGEGRKPFAEMIDKLEPMTIHDLRHTAASLAVSAGANVKAVQRMLGHASAAMTLDVYADLFDDDLNAISDRLDEAYQRTIVGDGPN